MSVLDNFLTNWFEVIRPVALLSNVRKVDGLVLTRPSCNTITAKITATELALRSRG